MPTVERRTSLRLGKRTAPESRNIPLEVLTHLPASILIIASNLEITFANRNFLVKSRKEEHEVIGRQVREIFPPVILRWTHLERRIRKVCETALPFDGGEMEYRAPGLARRVYFFSLTPLNANDGQVTSVMLFMDDVTEKKSLGERIREVERHLASVVESAHDLIISLYATGAVMTWNAAAERILGFSPPEVVGRPFADLLSPADSSALATLFSTLNGEASVPEFETATKAKNGRELFISWRFSAMHDEDGRVAALVGVGRDLTEKRQLELRMIQSAKMAALGEMAGGVAHEMRNPLAIASSAAQILLKRGDDCRLRQECAEKIHMAAGRAAVIIENLLRFARPSEGEAERVDVNAAVEETLSLIGYQVSLQSIEVERRLAPRLPRVKGNKNQLQWEGNRARPVDCLQHCPATRRSNRGGERARERLDLYCYFTRHQRRVREMLEVLVVDDEEDICWALENGLADEGVHITRVLRAEDAIEAVRVGRFDAAIIDVKLPGKSGIEVSRVIRQLAPQLSIVMISGFHYEEDQPIQEGLRRGDFQGFMSKPFELDDLSAFLRQVVKEAGSGPSSWRSARGGNPRGGE